MRWMIVALILAALRTAAAEPIAVKVIEVAGNAAYLSAGRAAGVVPGTVVTIRGNQLTVSEATEKSSVVRLDDKQLVNVGDTGTANVTPGAAASVKRLPPPRQPEQFVGQWPAPVLPATMQDPAPVALGSGRPPGRAHVAVIGRGYAAADRSGRDGDVEGRVIASFDLMTDRPLAADLDVAGRAFFSGYDASTRTPLLVRTAQIRYGDASDPRVALGRLRYAASSLGMLDGGRGMMRIGNVEIAAFGGIVPDPLSGKPDTGAARFGGEVVYDDADNEWQPRVAVTAHGSTWQGELDERRLSLVTSVNRASLWLDGWGEVQSFPAGNPFDAKPVELTGAGASAQWRKRGLHAGVDLSYLRPERSLRLAAALPLEWLCTPLHVFRDTATTCGGAGSWTTSSASAGMRTTRWSVDAIGTLGVSNGVYRGIDRSAYVRGELYLGPARAQAAASVGKASFGSWNAIEVGGGYAPTRRLDLSARYRPELLDYVASTGPMLLHSIVVDGRFTQSPQLDLSLSTVATTGADRDALALLAIVVWRPLP